MDSPLWLMEDGRLLEMFELSVKSRTGSYQIDIGLGSVEGLYDQEFVVIADAALDHISKAFGNRVIRIQASESNKNLATCEFVIQQMKELGCNRGTVIIAIGGGFIQDVATLASSLYMRGIAWIYLPTTLMAMMDSCIGGKSSINVGTSKNLIGNFYPPTKIIIDMNFTSSLGPTAIASGLGEGVKICYAKGPSAFEKFCTYREEITNYDSILGAELVMHILSSKKWFVETDEFDVGPRQLLNFGHTFGHALESATNFGIPHGIAICLGVIAALKHPLSHTGDPERRLMEECMSILAPIVEDLREPILSFSTEEFAKAFLADKKHLKDKFRLILSQQGTLQIIEIERNDQNVAQVLLSMQASIAKVFGI